MNSNEHNPKDQWPGENISDSPIYDTNGKIKLVTIVTLSTIAIIMALSYLYDRWYLPRSRSHHIRRRSRNMFFFATDPSPASVTASRGLDPAVVKSLTVFAFSDATHKDPIDCAVCLSEFEEGESGRVLTGCKHAFHWLTLRSGKEVDYSHSTCPLCRSLVEPPATTTTVEEQVTIITISPELCSTSVSGSSAMPLDNLGREPVAIETPRRSLFEDDLTRYLLANHSFTSPTNRMLSFTRMLSRKGRIAPSSFAGAPSQSPSSSCQIVMTESDIELGEKKR
ncbi:RING-H2 finger protein ATL2-like [Brassica napus]|uniref:RING-H2 finger protein ATL2-like n=1 Tax=Brassica napus TaxID=3708 RepID=UPI002078A612|nr:RING-H2 finger protein ATL2-like [Brassica napus]